MRDRYKDIRKLEADVVVIGTGDLAYAKAFVEDDRIPFLVLVDDDARAANAASVQRAGVLGMLNPASFPGGVRAWRSGYRVGKPGPRVDQLGATFVVGPGLVVHYAHYDEHTADHAPMKEIFAALRF